MIDEKTKKKLDNIIEDEIRTTKSYDLLYITNKIIKRIKSKDGDNNGLFDTEIINDIHRFKCIKHYITLKITELFSKYKCGYHEGCYLDLNNVLICPEDINYTNSKHDTTNDSLHLIIKPPTIKEKNVRKNMINHLAEFTKDAESIVIVDPYFLTPGREESNLLTEMKKAINIDNNSRLNKITLVVDNGEINRDFSKKFKKMIDPGKIKLTVYSCADLHDRFWFVDGEKGKGKVLGHSFNGIGRKFGFLLDLPESDFIEAWKCYDRVLRKLKITI